MGYLFAAMSILLVSFAQLAMKWGMSRLPEPSIELLQSGLDSDYLLPTGFVLAGLFSYALSMASWLLALTHLPLNRAYPLLSISYILVYVSAVLLPWFDDAWSILHLFGIASIGVGVILVTRRKSQQA